MHVAQRVPLHLFRDSQDVEIQIREPLEVLVLSQLYASRVPVNFPCGIQRRKSCDSLRMPLVRWFRNYSSVFRSGQEIRLKVSDIYNLCVERAHQHDRCVSVTSERMNQLIIEE